MIACSRSKTHMLSWVGLAKTPQPFNSRQSCQAVLPLVLFFSSTTMAFNKPRPRTHSTNGEFRAWIPERKTSPNLMARSANFSSMRTSRAVIATAHPSGLLIHDSSPSEIKDMTKLTRHKYYHARQAWYTTWRRGQPGQQRQGTLRTISL